MQITRKKQALLTVFANLFLQFTNIICGFILPPLIIKSYGSVLNGMVSSITQFISYLNIVEAGIGGAAIVALYKPLAQKDENQISGILSATKNLYLRSGFVFSALVVLLAVVYPLIVKNQVNVWMSGPMVLILGLTGAGEFFLIGKYKVLLTADSKVYVFSFIRSGAVILNTLVGVLLIRLNCSILLLKLITSLIFLSRFVLLYLYVHKKYPSLSYNSNPDYSAVSQSKNVLVHQIAGMVVFNTPLVLISIFCTLEEASIYSIYNLVFTGLTAISGAFYNGIQSFLGESFVKDDIKKTRKLFDKFQLMFFVVNALIYICAALLIMPFMKYYTRNMTDADYIQPKLAMLFCIVGYMNNLRQPSSQLINAAGHYKQTQVRAIIEASLCLVFSIIFVNIIGFYGVLLGAVVSFSYRVVDMILYANHKLLHQKAWKTVIEVSVLSIGVAIAVGAIRN